MLIVFGGLPATGKSTLARALAQERHAVYLRIDTIEQALRSAELMGEDVGPAGYVIACALAEANLRLGLTVVADAVNPLALTRNAWRGVASATASDLVEIEVVCSDPAEHRRRVETRAIDVAGLRPPSWQDIVDACARGDYEPWDRPRIVVDTTHRMPAETLAELYARIDGESRRR